MKIKLIPLLALFALLSSCKYQEITVGTPENLKIGEVKSGNINLSVDLPVNNPNSFSFKIKKIDLDVYVDDLKAGKVNKSQKTRVKAKSNEMHSINVSFKASDLFGNGFKIASAMAKGNPEIKVKGNMKVGKLFITKKINIDNKEMLKIY
ncbi:MAG: LEA type 2 family protein [Bacteroidales bacterium]|nr:LEA type 2 family protein [Bacteroidales bacterium]